MTPEEDGAGAPWDATAWALWAGGLVEPRRGPDARLAAGDAVGSAETHGARATALDAHALGRATRVLTDLTVPVTPELGAAAREELAAAGVTLVASDAVGR